MNEEIRLAAIELANLEHADAVMKSPELGRITGKKPKGSSATNTVGNVLTFTDNGVNRKFVISVSVTAVDPDWKPEHAKDIAPDNGCEDLLEKYQKYIKKFLMGLHDDIKLD